MNAAAQRVLDRQHGAIHAPLETEHRQPCQMMAAEWVLGMDASMLRHVCLDYGWLSGRVAQLRALRRVLGI